MTGIRHADLHMHTTVSDGQMSVQQVVEHVARRGHLNVIAITDHDRLDASLWAYARRERYPFEVVPGVEVSTREGHVLALWVTDPIPMHLSLSETVHAIHERGGLAILAHPYFAQMGEVRSGWQAYRADPQHLIRAGLDGLEGFNASVILPGTNRRAQQMARTLGLAITGGSDAHTVGAIGSGRTNFIGTGADDLRAAIEARQTSCAGRPWPLREYVSFVRDFVARRGCILASELELELESAFDAGDEAEPLLQERPLAG